MFKSETEMWHVTDPSVAFPDLHEVSYQHRSFIPLDKLQRDVANSSGLLTHVASFFQEFVEWLKDLRNVL